MPCCFLVSLAGQKETMNVKHEAALNAENTTSRRKTMVFFAVIAYVLLVLGVDALAAQRVAWPFDWSVFQWRPDTLWRFFDAPAPSWTQLPLLRLFDVFKFLFWFALPFCLCLSRMDWSWFSPKHWKRVDLYLLVLLVLLGGIAVVSVAFIPALRAAYPGLSHLPWSQRLLGGGAMLMWVASWLLGWEFLHRYVLLRAALWRFPRFGWLAIPLFETVYHLQKPGLEALGMALFSLALTWWSMKRRNLLLPFLAHVYIELALITALVFFL